MVFLSIITIHCAGSFEPSLLVFLIQNGISLIADGILGPLSSPDLLPDGVGLGDIPGADDDQVLCKGNQMEVTGIATSCFASQVVTLLALMLTLPESGFVK